MSQDASQRNKTPQQWAFVKYDALGRSIMTGNYIYKETSADAAIVPDRSKREWLQSYSDTLKIIWEKRNVNDILTGYTNKSIPRLTLM
ncbi:hypothetical protein SAMN05421827_1256 [Pedobacter terrae]|uniref:Uncharacterized protein n=1 Tax=Pedobacter terrae TaxID=405671 RepID=A0A1G8CIC1_9SPHI|nr:hypothetical protein [Pedobacter terrae]SDH45119.1 hypothetical protein SAMN05421827_1256 [Pedobacter terrae]